MQKNGTKRHKILFLRSLLNQKWCSSRFKCYIKSGNFCLAINFPGQQFLCIRVDRPPLRGMVNEPICYEKETFYLKLSTPFDEKHFQKKIPHLISKLICGWAGQKILVVHAHKLPSFCLSFPNVFGSLLGLFEKLGKIIRFCRHKNANKEAL